MFNCGPGKIHPNTAADAVVVQDEYLQLPTLPLWPQVQYLFNLCSLAKHMSSETVPTSADSNYTSVILRDSKGTTVVMKQSQMWDQENVCTGW
jgi:hypothetical protein